MTSREEIDDFAWVLTQQLIVLLDEKQQERKPSARISRKKLAFRARLEKEFDRQVIYDDPSRQDIARNSIPVEQLHREARLREEADPEKDFQEELMKAMLKWYKNDFFKWVNAPECEYCNSATQSFGMASPTPEETKWQADRVELYECTVCLKLSRFPRYNNPIKLLETRRGRCGEWANVFMLLCKTMGFEVRYVADYTDHVWVEWWNERQNRWMHADCCEGEGAFDTPLMYEQGWGKKLSYAFAFGTYEAVDVIRRYTANMIDVQTRRTDVPESWLAEALRDMTNKKAQLLPESVRIDLQRRREDEQLELAQPHLRALRPEEMLGRQSGSLSWRSERGETGVNANAGSGRVKEAAKPSRSSTSLAAPLYVAGEASSSSSTGGSKDKGRDKDDDLKGRIVARVPTRAISGLSVALAGSASIAKLFKNSNSSSSSTTSTSSSKSVIQLTPPTNGLVGSAFLPSTISIAQGLVISFYSSMSSTTAGPGGLAVLFTTKSSYGGPGTGSFNIDGTDYAMAVTLGTDPCQQCGATSTTHVALYASNKKVACTTLPHDLANGRVYAIRVVLGINGQGVKVYVTRDPVENDDSQADYETVLDANDVTISVGTATGGKVGFVGNAGEVSRRVQVFDITAARLA
ncbi:hypothetical protein SmJEL517_g03456 [Synchytrium microbalum]|uniref:Transglutaminase-like domain-containing protein n=1 Tax=Synchytrium microbalum TaxID=1806994 RepID=A0A507C224_9FUNG|nr:uncharacterized protein SmJEL517_g03456 [Synchytrium microbalum]TPX33762.1 hypothetical protein SmJEL517_g03456 [Synchytrium microbalum]